MFFLLVLIASSEDLSVDDNDVAWALLSPACSRMTSPFKHQQIELVQRRRLRRARQKRKTMRPSELLDLGGRGQLPYSDCGVLLVLPPDKTAARDLRDDDAHWTTGTLCSQAADGSGNGLRGIRQVLERGVKQHGVKAGIFTRTHGWRSAMEEWRPAQGAGHETGALEGDASMEQARAVYHVA